MLEGSRCYTQKTVCESWWSSSFSISPDKSRFGLILSDVIKSLNLSYECFSVCLAVAVGRRRSVIDNSDMELIGDTELFTLTTLISLQTHY